MRRWAETVSAGGLVALAVTPFVALFPDPPAFGRGAAGIVAVVAILATVGTAFRATHPRRRRILAWACILLAITVASVAIRIVLARTMAADVATLDILPAVFGLQGEDIDDAVLYEGWLELWLGCGLVTTLVHGLHRAANARRPRPQVVPSPWDRIAPQPVAAPSWNAATVLLWLVGWAVLAGAVVDGHWTEEFLERAVHVTGTIVDAQPHPHIRFTVADGAVVVFTQNGSVSRALGAAVPVAYLTVDPAGSARADTFWANWSNLLGLLWMGLGFTLFPFYGFRARFRGSRW
jgi:hypothetical protein